jgi:hypothetical protein
MHYDMSTKTLNIGSFVMNFHHQLLRFGIITDKRVDDDGWTQFKVDFFEDNIYEANVDWSNKMRPGSDNRKYEYRADQIKPVDPVWIQNVMESYGGHEDECRSEIA